MKTQKDIRVPKSRAERQAELAGMSQEEKDRKSEAAQARVHNQVRESKKRAAKIVAERDARRARGGDIIPEGGDGDG